MKTKLTEFNFANTGNPVFINPAKIRHFGKANTSENATFISFSNKDYIVVNQDFETVKKFIENHINRGGAEDDQG